MFKQNKKEEPKKPTHSLSWKSGASVLKKFIYSTAIATLLFPVFAGVVVAESLSSDEQPTEEVVSESTEEVEITEEDTSEESSATDSIEESDMIESVDEPEESDELLPPLTETDASSQAEVVEKSDLAPAVAVVETEEEATEAEELSDENVMVQPMVVANYQLAIVIETADFTTLTNIPITVKNEAGDTVSGSFNSSGQWQANENVPAGKYIVTFSPSGEIPIGLYPSMRPDPAVKATKLNNVFEIDVNADITAWFLYMDKIHLNMQFLEDQRPIDYDFAVSVKDANGKMYDGEFDIRPDGSAWSSDGALPVGTYTFMFSPPAGKQVIINEVFKNQKVRPTNTRNVFLVDINAKSLTTSFSVMINFELIDELPPDPIDRLYNIAVIIHGDGEEYLTNVGVKITDADGKDIGGGLLGDIWYSSSTEGRYTITLTPPAGMVAVIHTEEGLLQSAVATDKANVFTIDVNEDNISFLNAVLGSFRLEKADSGKPTDPSKPTDPGKPTETPTGPVTPDKSDAEKDDTTEDMDNKEDTTGIVDDAEAMDDVVFLPATGVGSSALGLGAITLLSGIGLYMIDKRRRK